MDNNVLIVAPHPDDEVLGCGGTIKKLTSAGVSVYVLVVTRGKKELYSDERIENVRSEASEAHKILGVAETRFFDYPAPDLDMISLADLSRSISAVIQEYNVDTIYLPHLGDIHHDHKIVFNAGLVAARPTGSIKVRRIYAYETLSETEWAAPIGSEVFIPTRFVDINTVFQYKLQAIQCYKSQVRDFPNPRSLKAIEALAVLRGSMSGLMLAEAFMTIRTIDL
jgi:N-acetylglucosamine malate deacetylase 1